MKKGLAILTSVVFGLVLFTSGAMAYDFGTNITISDEDYRNNPNNDWYRDREDQETEPGTLTNQDWDLEGMFLGESDVGGETHDILTIVGGYDFIDNSSWASGDIYFDLGGSTQDDSTTAKFGMGAHNPNNDPDAPDSVYDRVDYDNSTRGNLSVKYNWGYDLVFDIDWENFNVGDTTFNYDVYQLTDESYNKSTHYNAWDESGAWRYDTEQGSAIFKGSGEGTYLTGLTDSDVGFDGGNHNALSIDLTGFVDPTKFVSHFTMQCGNDNLMGDPVPEPSTIILLGLGILGLVGFRKKFVK